MLKTDSEWKMRCCSNIFITIRTALHRPVLSLIGACTVLLRRGYTCRAYTHNLLIRIQIMCMRKEPKYE